MKAVSTEKALRMIETENTILFKIDRTTRKPELKKEIEKLFNVKVENIRTHIDRGEKTALVRLKKESSAPELATKLGLI
jgi:large subunit ribosomal protein L23